MSNKKDLLLCSFIIMLMTSGLSGQTYKTDSAAIKQVFYSAGYDRTDISSYITKDPMTERIISLVIPAKSSAGKSKIDTSIALITELRSLTIKGGSWAGDYNELPDTLPLKLQNLFLSGNQFSKLPASLLTDTSLRHIDISNNNFTRIPSDLFQACTTLAYFNVSNNKIDSIPLLKRFPDTLLVSGCKLRNCSENLTSVIPPRYADFSNNGICGVLSGSVKNWLSACDPDWNSTQLCTQPSISLRGFESDTIQQFHPYYENGAVASDPFDGNLDSKVIITGIVDTLTVGTYELIYSVTDIDGNTVSIKRTVYLVKDTTQPSIALKGKQYDTINLGAQYYDPGFKATDTDINLTNNVTVKSDLDISKEGSYTISYSVTDRVGLVTEVSRYVVVINGFVNANIAVNQIGYYPDLPKTATISSSCTIDSFSLCTVDNKIVYTKALVKNKSCYIADFSSCTEPGVYYIVIPQLGKSFTFKIDNHIYADAFRASLKAFYFQRSSFSVKPEYGDKWARNSGHPDTSLLMHSTTGKTGSYSSPGGWYDAGDYGKYIVNGGITLATLMSLYEICPDLVRDGDINIPESGNGKSDLLDEIKYELDWFKTMQDVDSGVFFKVGPLSFPGFVMPEMDTSQRYVIGKSTASALNFAAVMAQAGRVFKSYDSAYADDCSVRAEKAYAWAQANPSVLYPSEKGGTGLYNDEFFSDEKMWAATELWVTTGKQLYGDYCKPAIGQSYRGYSTWADVDNQNIYTIISNKNKYYSDFSNSVKKFYDGVQYQILPLNKSDFPVSESALHWGSNGNHLNMLVNALSFYYWGQDTAYLNVTARAIDYIFGRNKHSKSFVTGFGKNSPLFPHHRISGADNVADPIPGFVVGGENCGREDGDSIYYTYDICYLDNQKSFATNEVAINWNAPLVFVLGFLENLHGGLPPKDPVNISKRIKSKSDAITVSWINRGSLGGFMINKLPPGIKCLEVELFDLTGRCLYNKTIEDPYHKNYILFNSKGLASQIRVARITGDGISIRKSFIIAR